MINRKEFIEKQIFREKVRSVIREIHQAKIVNSLKEKHSEVIKEDNSKHLKRMNTSTAANALEDFIHDTKEIWKKDYASLGEESQRVDYRSALKELYEDHLAAMDLNFFAQQGVNPLSPPEEQEMTGMEDPVQETTLNIDMDVNDDGIVDPDGEFEEQNPGLTELDPTSVDKATATYEQTKGTIQKYYKLLHKEQDRAIFTAYLPKNIDAHLALMDQKAKENPANLPEV